ncbi:hypothetical protein DFH07DRAFT_839595 [Mycena maculata]|uniref:Uncharacterized protein n=1 Tax=Mycena maculata TaxID=230809 RepID=A0AAD7N034_9AGAR|nr:hypothetical protein DFH07DRAFT_839595 [Mycena maculata]
MRRHILIIWILGASKNPLYAGFRVIQARPYAAASHFHKGGLRWDNEYPSDTKKAIPGAAWMTKAQRERQIN